MKRLLTVLALLCGSSIAIAEELTFEQVMSTFTDQVEVRVTEGRIEALNLINRTGTIGGYRYYFGPSTLSMPLRVKLLGRNFGSLELLTIGMDVRVQYFVSPDEHRIATELVQIEEAEQH